MISTTECWMAIGTLITAINERDEEIRDLRQLSSDACWRSKCEDAVGEPVLQSEWGRQKAKIERLREMNANLQAAFDEANEETQRYGELLRNSRIVDREKEIERLRGLLREVGTQQRRLADLFRGAQVPAGTNAALDSIERCVREALGE